MGVNRRIMLASLPRSIDDLTKTARDEPEAFKVISESVDRFKGHAEALLEFAQVATKRLEAAEKQR